MDKKSQKKIKPWIEKNTPSDNSLTIAPLEDLQTSEESEQTLTDRDLKAVRTIKTHSFTAVGAMIIIPIPGVDMVATYAVWGKMIYEIAHIYGEEISLEDARALAADLFKGGILTTLAWFASAKTASEVLKFIPGAGTLAAYVIDATIAGFGAKKITAALGFSAAAYYKSGRKIKAPDLFEEIAKILKNPKNLEALLLAIAPLLSSKAKLLKKK